MEAELGKLGGSLPVPCVQELVKEPLVKVPARYTRPDQDPPSNTSLLEVPVIDMQLLLSNGDSMDSELQKLHHACRDWGFFQLINQGVSSSLVEKVKLETQEFFNMPMEEKKKFWQKGDIQGFGQIFVLSDEQKLDWADLFYLYTLPRNKLV